jgi:hypothetical protein
MDHALNSLDRRVAATKAAALAAEALTRSAPPQSQQGTSTTGSYSISSYDNPNSADIKTANGKVSAAESYASSATDPPRSQYGNPVAQYAYPDPSTGSNLAYQPPVDAYNSTSYPAADRTQLPLPQPQPALPQSAPPLYGHSPTANSYYNLLVPNQTGPVQNEWMRWSQSHLTFFPQQGAQVPQLGQEYISSANTLMTLSGRGGAAMVDGGQVTVAEDPGRQWPMNLFTLGQGPGGSGSGGGEAG